MSWGSVLISRGCYPHSLPVRYCHLHDSPCGFGFRPSPRCCEPVVTARPTTCHLPLATCNPPRLDHSSLHPKPVSRTQCFLVCIWSIQILKWALPVLCAAWLFFHDFNTTGLRGLSIQGYVLHFLGSYTLLQDLKLEQRISPLVLKLSQHLFFGTLCRSFLAFDLTLLHLLPRKIFCLLSLDFSNSGSCLQGHRPMQCAIRL